MYEYLRIPWSLIKLGSHYKHMICIKAIFLFWFGGILVSASGAEFPVCLSNHVGFTPRLLYSSIIG